MYLVSKPIDRSFAIAASMFMNSNSLPVALMQSLVVTVHGLKWSKDDNKNAMLGRALTYLVLYSTFGMIVSRLFSTSHKPFTYSFHSYAGATVSVSLRKLMILWIHQFGCLRTETPREKDEFVTWKQCCLPPLRQLWSTPNRKGINLKLPV